MKAPKPFHMLEHIVVHNSTGNIVAAFLFLRDAQDYAEREYQHGTVRVMKVTDYTMPSVERTAARQP